MENDNIGKVFSEGGLSALEDFEFSRSGVFWIGIISTNLWLTILVFGF